MGGFGVTADGIRSCQPSFRRSSPSLTLPTRGREPDEELSDSACSTIERQLLRAPFHRFPIRQQLHLNIPAGGFRVGADGVRLGHERFGLRLVDTRKFGVELGVDEEAAVFLVEADGGRDFDVGHLQRNFREAGRGPDRAAEAGRVAGGEELLGVRAWPVRAGRRKLEVDLAVGTGGFAFSTGGGAGGFCREYGHGLAPGGWGFGAGDWRELRREVDCTRFTYP